MSEAQTTTQLDFAIEAIDEQTRALDASIAENTRRIEVDTAIRERLLELRATLSRKPRARRPRGVDGGTVARAMAQSGFPPIREVEPGSEPRPALTIPPVPENAGTLSWPGFSVVPSTAE